VGSDDKPTQTDLFSAERGERGEGGGMRNLSLERPMAFLDLETTGTSPENDRIVEVCAIVVRADGGRETFIRRVNPGIPIPAEATAVHGIHDADVADAPTFAKVAPELLEQLEGADLAGFNILSYDLPLLEAELARYSIEFSRAGRRVVDVQRIYHQRERRDLTAAVRLYAGREHEGAHGAEADVIATIDVLEQGKLQWAGEELTLGFGKHRGKSLRALVKKERNYLEWILSSDFPADTKAILREALAGRFPDPKR